MEKPKSNLRDANEWDFNANEKEWTRIGLD